MSDEITPAPLRRARWLIAASVAAAAVAAVAVALPMLTTSSAEPARLTQPASGGPASACAELTPEFLAGADTAFRASVKSFDGEIVTLGVSERFTGDILDVVTTSQGTDQGVDGEPIEFQSGVTYLLAARDGMIWTCGASGPATPELEALYNQAFTR